MIYRRILKAPVIFTISIMAAFFYVIDGVIGFVLNDEGFTITLSFKE
jgi:hypothetical protein